MVLVYVPTDKNLHRLQMRLIGSNMKFAKYLGSTSSPWHAQLLFGGFLSGVGGAAEILGRHNRFQWMALPGFDGTAS